MSRTFLLRMIDATPRHLIVGLNRLDASFSMITTLSVHPAR